MAKSRQSTPLRSPAHALIEALRNAIVSPNIKLNDGRLAVNYKMLNYCDFGVSDLAQGADETRGTHSCQSLGSNQ